MDTKLATIGRQLTFSLGCEAKSTALTWTREPTIDELNADDYIVQRCDESAAWWMGDIVTKRWHLEGAGMSLALYAEKYAHARGLNEQTTIHRAEVAQYYPPEVRYDRPVSWSHHYIVFCHYSADGLSVCVEWLERAAKGAWNTGKLRQEIAIAKDQRRAEKEPELPRSELDDAAPVDSWASTMLGQVAVYDAARARRLLNALHCTVALVDLLKKRADTKESFTPATLRR